jgi:hypothetical protein
MSGKKPLFASAPRLVIGIRNSDGVFKKIGYAIGLNINVSTTVQPIYILGDLAPAAYEPTQYQPVTGSFQIVRLQSNLQRQTRKTASQILYDKTKIINKELIDTSVASATGNNVLYENNIWDHLNPVKILTSATFDIEIYMNYTNYGHAISDANVSTLANPVQSSGTVAAATSNASTVSLVKFMVLHDCRLTSRNVNIAQGQLVNEPLNFQGLLAQQNFDTTNPSRNEKLDSIIKEQGI